MRPPEHEHACRMAGDPICTVRIASRAGDRLSGRIKRRGCADRNMEYQHKTIRRWGGWTRGRRHPPAWSAKPSDRLDSAGSRRSVAARR
jgi:hypothetical protein